MKFNTSVSVDGFVRSNLMVNFRFGRQELITIICWHIAQQAEIWKDNQFGILNIEEKNQFKNRREIINKLKDAYYDSGINFGISWSEGRGDVICTKIENYAATVIDDLFPEFKIS